MAKAPADIRSLARVHTESALNTLVHIMRQPSAPPSARVTAAQVLLDRGWGKPHQTSEVSISQRDASQLTDAELTAIIREHVPGKDDDAPMHSSRESDKSLN